MIPDKARQRLVNTILTQGMDQLDQGADSEVLEDVVINLQRINAPTGIACCPSGLVGTDP